MALTDLLNQRRAEIAQQIKALKAELDEIQIAQDALAGGKQTRAPVGRSSGVVRFGSFKHWILQALQTVPDGLETDDVIRTVLSMGGPEISRSSMTPQLSRLKAATLVEQVGRRWRIARFMDPMNGEVAQALATGVIGFAPDADREVLLQDLLE